MPSQPSHAAPRTSASPARRLVRLALVAGVAALAATTLRDAPRETTFVYRLGPAHAEVTAARVRYEQRGELVASLAVRHPEGAPTHLRHVVTLPPGRTRLVAVTERAGRTERFERALTVPAEGEARIELFTRSPGSEASAADGRSARGSGTPAAARAPAPDPVAPRTERR